MKKCYMPFYNKTAIIECTDNTKYTGKVLSIDYDLNTIITETQIYEKENKQENKNEEAKYYGLVVFSGENIKTIEFN